MNIISYILYKLYLVGLKIKGLVFGQTQTTLQ